MGTVAATGTTAWGDGEEIASRGLGPFVTERTFRFADGTLTRWDSRRERKRARTDTESTWWAPRALGWWIAVLFAVGATCFTVAAVPSLAAAVGSRTDNLVYFVGSLFFTGAGLLVYAQVAGVDDPGVAGTGRRARVLLVPRPRRIDWLAAVVQSAGTLFFNVSTGHALWTVYPTTAAANHGVWRPDALGSICFLVSSYLSYAEVCHGGARWEPTSLPWWITVGNLVGSVAFGVSAVASKLDPSGDLRSGAWTTAGTFVGGLCFLGASILLMPERTAARAAPALRPPTPSPTGT